MRKTKPVPRVTGLLAGFDKTKLRQHVEAADQQRALTQDELAHNYFGDADIVDMALQFPASIEDIVEGICAQDERFLESGRTLLGRLLRKATAGKADKPTRRSRGTGVTRGVVPQTAPARNNAVNDSVGAQSDAGGGTGTPLTTSVPTDAAPFSDMFPNGGSAADMYGG